MLFDVPMPYTSNRETSLDQRPPGVNDGCMGGVHLRQLLVAKF